MAHEPSIVHARSPSQNAIECIEWLRDYAERRINSRLIDERRCIPPYIVLDFGNRGLMGMQVPVALGGKLELSLYDVLRVQRQLAAVDMTLAFLVGSQNVLGIRPICKFGTSELQERFVPLLSTGRMLAAFAYTESNAGSNPLDIEATARQSNAGGFLLNGKKVFIGNACCAGVVNVFAKQLSSEGKARGQAAFCLPAGLDGIRHGEESLTMGIRGMVQNSISFEDVGVDSEYMLGEPGGGLAVASDAMLACRLGIAAMCVGAMWRALQLAGRYAGRRVIGSAVLLDSDLVRARIASMHAAAQVADRFIDKLACDLDDGVAVPPEAYSAAKALCSEWLWETLDASIQMVGARGYIETNCLPQMMRDARMARIGEGPTDTMLMHVGKRVLDAQSPLFDYIAACQTAAEGASALREQIDRMRERRSASADAGAIGYRLAGELASLHLVRACNSDGDCVRWLDARIARLAEACWNLAPVSRARAQEMVAQAALAVGDIEQAAPDEDRVADPYLRKEFA